MNTSLRGTKQSSNRHCEARSNLLLLRGIKHLALILLLSFCCVTHLYSQITTELLGDTIKVHKKNGTPAEFVLKNGTKSLTNGVLVNIGNGVTKFKCVVDSLWKSNDTTLCIKMCGSTTCVTVGAGGGGTTIDTTIHHTADYNDDRFLKRSDSANTSLSNFTSIGNTLKKLDSLRYTHNYILPEWFAGADNTEKIQAAIDYASTVGGNVLIKQNYDLVNKGTNPYNGSSDYCLIIKSNVRLTILPGVYLRLANAQQSTRPVDVITGKYVRNVVITGGGKILGNTANQTWAGGYAQETAGNLIKVYGTSSNRVGRTYINSNIEVSNLELADAFSNPCTIDQAENVLLQNIYSWGVGEGVQSNMSKAVVFNRIRIKDSTNVMVGDFMEAFGSVDVHILNCEIYGYAGNTTSSSAIDIGGAYNAIVDGLIAYDVNNVIGLQDANGNNNPENIRITNVYGYISDATKNHIDIATRIFGVSSPNAKNIYISNCYFKGGQAGINLATEGGIDSVAINDCVFDSLSYGVNYAYSTTKVRVMNCTFRTVLSGIRLPPADSTLGYVIGSVFTNAQSRFNGFYGGIEIKDNMIPVKLVSNTTEAQQLDGADNVEMDTAFTVGFFKAGGQKQIMLLRATFTSGTGQINDKRAGSPSGNIYLIGALDRTLRTGDIVAFEWTGAVWQELYWSARPDNYGNITTGTINATTITGTAGVIPTLFGSTSVNGNLELRSTNQGTAGNKGYIYVGHSLAPTLIVDEINKNVGIGGYPLSTSTRLTVTDTSNIAKVVTNFIANDKAGAFEAYQAGALKSSIFFAGSTYATTAQRNALNYYVNNAAHPHQFWATSTMLASISSTGMSVKTGAAATAWLHLGAGTATASTAPLKFTSGTLLTTPEAGAVEYNSGLWYSDSSTSVRDTFAMRQWTRYNFPSFGHLNAYATTASLSSYLLKDDSTLYGTKADTRKVADSLAADYNAALTGKQNANSELDAFVALAVNGLVVKAGTNSYAARTITAGTGITVTNGNGISNNPVIDADTSTAGGGLSTRANRDKLKDSLDANIALKANIASPTFTGTVTIPSGSALGTPTTLVGTNITGTASGLTAGTVTTNANLTGDVTSSGNATTVVKINGTTLSGLATGILKNTTGTGVPSIAAAGTDYTTPSSTETVTNKDLTSSTNTFPSSIKRSNTINLQQDLGSVIVAEPMWDISQATTTYTLANQTVVWVAVRLAVGQTVTGVKWLQGTQGNYTANNNNKISLYSYSAGTMTLQASCATDGNLWKGTGGTLQTKAFSSTYVAAAGTYYIAFIYCRSAETTAPTIGAANSANAVGWNLGDNTNSARFVGTLTTLTDLPTPTQVTSSLNAIANRPYVALY